MSKSRLSPALAPLAGILLMVVLIACRGEPPTPQSPSPPPTATPMPKLTPNLTLAVTPLESTRIISEEIHEFVTEDILEAHRLKPYLVGNLLFIAHWDEDVQRWFVYDVAGYFTPDQLTPPPEVAIPPDPEIATLNELERG